MLHHAEPRFFFCLMHLFGLFKFEFVACLNLNPKENIKEKRIRKFGIKRKGKEAQPPLPRPFDRVGPANLARAHVSSLQGGSCLLVPNPIACTRSIPPFLSILWGCLVGTGPPARSHALLLTRGPHPSAPSPYPLPPRLHPQRAPRADKSCSRPHDSPYARHPSA
jgi:hypothetical protein